MVLQPIPLLLAAGLQLLMDVQFLSFPFSTVQDEALGQSIIFVLLKILPINRSSTLGKSNYALIATLEMKSSRFLLHRMSSGQARSGNTTTSSNANKKKKYGALDLTVQSWMKKYVWATLIPCLAGASMHKLEVQPEALLLVVPLGDQQRPSSSTVGEYSF
ncbi:hypothetical protein AXG93_2035s1690 [Marchantia polymorpha subsp. ruderalis]|uniref:Uncharacterized protein n=1 Tax=Marchantia polymorpha subsp. ruderalis TaxID=1480154 RepID=A0A176VRW5_MARPO|nr:hypothetical protein AXG93_2035s1690 [Marchantia polymorpha subsp. ruderalis]